MIDEELENEAEEYALGMMGNKYDEFCKLEQTYIDAYKKGCAEGRKERWHDLRKNPNDLPKDEEVLKEYLVAYQNFNNPNEIVVGCFTWNGARFLENYDYSEIPYFENKNVLFAWCELPKFEE